MSRGQFNLDTTMRLSKAAYYADFAMHALHHAAPRDFVGTPTWITLGILWSVFFLPGWRLWSFNTASGLIAGIMTGFLWYGVLHHIIHHGRPRAIASLLTRSEYRHRQHHHSGRHGNFGVTTSIWDHLFGTVTERPMRRQIASAVTGLIDRRH